MKLKTQLKNYLLGKFQCTYNTIWNQELFNDNRNNMEYGNKLRTFRLFKNVIKLEPYLLWGNFDQRRSLTKFRISAHDLEIEKGRYKNLKVAERVCRLCGTGTEDEVHFLLQCPRLRQSRISIIDQIALKYKNFLNLDTKAQFIWLMSAEDTFIFKKVNELLVNLSEKKKELLLTNDC